MLKPRFWQLIRRISTTKRREFERKTIETVCPRLHQYLFPHVPTPSTSSKIDYPGELPQLMADDIIEHFRILADSQVSKYRELLDFATTFDLNSAKIALKSIDNQDLWRFEPGWYKYPFEDPKNSEKIEAPLDDVLFFDIELVVRDGRLPTLAIALGKDAWYGWCSDRLINDSDVPEFPTIEHLIPIGETSREKIIIGHNIGFDRARCQEAYSTPKSTKIRFMDTMSMSIPMFGMADHQQSLYEMYDIEEIEGNNDWMNAWKGRVSKNSLVAVHDHLYPDKEVSAEGFSKKSMRASFVKDPISKIREDFQPLMSYCARDNILSAEIYLKLWPEFRRRFPHPATLYGMLNMGNVYLPINQYWKQFFDYNAQLCEEKKTASAKKIVEAASILAQTEENSESKIEEDIWMWSQDWTIKSNQQKPEWFNKLFKARNFAKLELDEVDYHHIALKSSLIPSIFGFIYGPFPLFKTRSKGWGFLAPGCTKTIEKFLGEDQEFIEVHTDFTMSSSSAKFPLKKFYETVQDNIFEFGDFPISDEKKGWDLDKFGAIKFYQLDHPNGAGNVGDPLTKHFQKDLKERVLRPTRFVEIFEKTVLDSIQTTQFWTSYSERYRDEVAIYYEQNQEDAKKLGAIAAAVVPAGTVSRRSVHKLWVTLTNQSGGHVIGTGIKAMVQASNGARLVGADVDSQEQWLAALYGDASAEKRLDLANRVAGKTAFSNMMLAGSKSDNTDLHSVVANQLKISRNHAKTLNYARLYGSGESHAAKHLMRIGGMKQAEAEKTASQLFKLTKGDVSKFQKIDPNFNIFVDKFLARNRNLDSSKILTIDGAFYLPTYTSKYAQETIEFEDWMIATYFPDSSENRENLICGIYEKLGENRKLFVGGYESSTFNFLEMKAAQQNLRTPILECQIADSLGKLPDGTPDAKFFDKKYKRSVMNWIVQSSAVDFLHLLLVSMEWLTIKYEIEARFVISIHDEVRYMCREEDAPRLALALQLSNLLVRAYISQKVGICQLPNTVAFFSQVDCDTVLRKEVDTVSINPDGTKIDNGVAWTIEDLLKLTKNGRFLK
ncbi:unnamed protein product [Caenorhabditis angaria]|uniref:DNA-directed DNA polymerase n=1 Tax=Caenorhabditis angaria TaxID=860376 RepID=A0A9P1ID31_9PELO|nr:unnamed protein product [Caenorhabditis angaria]